MLRVENAHMKYMDFNLQAMQPSVAKADGKKILHFKLVIPGIFSEPKSCQIDLRAVSGNPVVRLINKKPEWSDALKLGAILAEALLPPEVWEVLNNRITQAAAQGEGVRVRLMLSGSDLGNLPWEFLLFNRGGGENKVSDFLALMPNVSVVRHTATTLPSWKVKASLPLRLMVGIASPEDPKWPTLNIDTERANMEKALKHNTQIQVNYVEHMRKDQLPSNTSPAHLFHFAGHGAFELDQSIATPGVNVGTASVELEDEYGDADSLKAELLAVQLRQAGTRVAVLGACQTAQRDDAGAWSSAAEALLKAELGAVVGMQFPILDTSAIAFSDGFYKSLGTGLSIDEAVTTGRIAIAASEDPRGWATPVLYLRSPDGVVFPELEANQSLSTERHQIRKGLQQKIGVLKGNAIFLKIGRIETSDPGETMEEILEGVGNTGGSQEIGEVAVTGSATTVEIGIVKRDHEPKRRRKKPDKKS